MRSPLTDDLFKKLGLVLFYHVPTTAHTIVKVTLIFFSLCKLTYTKTSHSRFSTQCTIFIKNWKAAAFLTKVFYLSVGIVRRQPEAVFADLLHRRRRKLSLPDSFFFFLRKFSSKHFFSWTPT